MCNKRDQVGEKREQVEVERREVARLRRQHGRPERVLGDHDNQKDGERGLDEQKHAHDDHQHHCRRAALRQASTSAGTRSSLSVSSLGVLFRRRLVVVPAQQASAAFRVWLAMKQPVTAALGGADGSHQRRVEDDQRRARKDVDADDAETVVGVEEQVLVAVDARRQHVYTRLVVRRREVGHRPLRDSILVSFSRILVVEFSVLRRRQFFR